MWLRYIMLCFYCFRRGLRFHILECEKDKTLYNICIVKKDNPYDNYLDLYVSKKPCRKPYQIYNRIKFLIYHKMIKNKGKISKHSIDFGCYKLVSRF